MICRLYLLLMVGGGGVLVGIVDGGDGPDC